MTRTYYDVLRVSAHATHEEIRAAYRQAMRRTHPDITKKNTTAQFTEVQEAYAVLIDEQMRYEYDLTLFPNVAPPRVDESQPKFPVVHVDIHDILHKNRYRKESVVPRVPGIPQVVITTFTMLTFTVIAFSYAAGTKHLIHAFAMGGVLLVLALMATTLNIRHAAKIADGIGLASLVFAGVTLLSSGHILIPSLLGVNSLLFFGWSYVFQIMANIVTSHKNTEEAVSLHDAENDVFEKASKITSYNGSNERKRAMDSLGESLEVLLNIPGVRIFKNIRHAEFNSNLVFAHAVVSGRNIVFVNTESSPQRDTASMSVFTSLFPHDKVSLHTAATEAADIERVIRSVAEGISERHNGLVDRATMMQVWKWQIR